MFNNLFRQIRSLILKDHNAAKKILSLLDWNVSRIALERYMLDLLRNNSREVSKDLGFGFLLFLLLFCLFLFFGSRYRSSSWRFFLLFILNSSDHKYIPGRDVQCPSHRLPSSLRGPWPWQLYSKQQLQPFRRSQRQEVS